MGLATVTGRWRSGQSQQTVNLPPNGLRRFKSSPAHQPSLTTASEGGAVASSGEAGSTADDFESFGRRGDGAEPNNERRIRRAGLAGVRGRRKQGEDEGGSNSVVESQPSKLLVAGSIPVSRSSLRPRPQDCAGYG